MLDVALASCRVLPEPDPDQALLEEALARRGLSAATLPWDDPAVDWQGCRLVVLRSTWNYPHHAHEFLKWLDRTAATTRVWNPPAVVHSNIHKSYLLDLARRGVPVVPTRLVRHGARDSLRAVAGDWPRVVVKPAVSAASLHTMLVDGTNWAEGEEHLRRLTASRDVLVQPYLPAVEDEGERAVMLIAGALTHSVRKEPRFAAQDESVSAALPVGEAQRRLAQAALAAVEAPLLYGRVDVAPGPDGALVVMELELIEPSLFLGQHPPALERFADAIVRARRAVS